MMREGSLPAVDTVPVLPTRKVAGVALLQGVALCAVLAAMAYAGLALYLAVPLALLVLWLPHGRRPAPAPMSAPTEQEGELLQELARGTSHNALAAAAVAHSVQQLAARVQSQLGAAQDIVGSAEIMITTETATAQLSQQALDAARSAHGSSVAGSAVLAESIQRMRDLSERASASRALIEALHQRSEDIARVTLVIQAIASQTNLLALNAAIEAARAGEHGRGFAVVADEVRGLAGRTASATEEVGQMVADIQARTAQVVAQIRDLADDLGLGVEQVEQAGGQLAQIARLAASVEGQVGEIAEGTQTNQAQLDTLFQAVAQVRSDLEVSDQQTRRLTKAAVQMEGQVESLSERLAEVGLDAYHQRVFELAQAGARQIGERFAADVEQGRIGLDDLFDRQYRPIPGMQPPRFSTGFDHYTDTVLPQIQEPLLQHEGLVYAIACTQQGYVPTHNSTFNQPLTGDPQHDTAHNRSKRIFDDRTGIRCGNHQQRVLLQTYTRDTGELMHDLSVPIFVRGRHWGGLRLGYRPEPGLD
ncbi:methyl-accepting chemotaxis protein [Pseudomonas xantholysinigenes]|uniref:Methyl-accepting chemotaxis protein n=1 Tax=Pseudomonas xantholysinigenes TaxID=2745490 RepID=A0A9E6PTK3_9PSED|nr:methyl-accepting chemotaxis protein [Pseudomonas xantholysinigenes]